MNARTLLIAAAATAGLLSLAPAPCGAQSASGPQRAEFEKIIHDYIVQHPEVLQEAMAELARRQKAAEAERIRAVVKSQAQALFHSPRQAVIGNPDGDVTLVEFFDYNCGFCKRALADLLTLLADDPKLRVVLKEFPVMGPGSLEAALVAVAVRMQDKSGKKYLDFHQRLLGGRGQADKASALAAAREAGLDMAQLEKDMASEEARASIDESAGLARALGFTGTPSYVIGDGVVIGAVGASALREKIARARQ